MATSQIKVLDSVQGSSFLTSQAVMGVFKRHTPDIAPATIEVIRDGGSEFVVFTDKNRQFGVRAGTQVELNANDLHALLTNKDRIKVDALQGSSFLAIEAAMEVFKRRNPDLAWYKIEVVRDGEFVVVIFSDKDRPEGSKGNLSPRLGFEAVLDARDRRVLRSHFIR
jgi:hypothetical protein